MIKNESKRGRSEKMSQIEVARKQARQERERAKGVHQNPKDERKNKPKEREKTKEDQRGRNKAG